MLEDETYRTKSSDPTKPIMRKTVTLLRKTGLPEETIKSLRPQAPVPPRLYGLPKIHKEGVPLRPIVSAINSPNYLLARYLAKLLTPHVGKSIRHVKNSAEFVKTISQLKLDPTDIMEKRCARHGFEWADIISLRGSSRCSISASDTVGNAQHQSSDYRADDPRNRAIEMIAIICYRRAASRTFQMREQFIRVSSAEKGTNKGVGTPSEWTRGKKDVPQDAADVRENELK
ncbi:hypothetical protein J437_LFUL012809 [Ladona fulva]|uniref:Reverse transcriptase n=1 Tax=Ladona fulva TaxID=123851 RepID=A0A8K0P829_LADFU|nr:hypothetical protein J437_LFUL012809 [Ladona fulva]